VRDTIVAVPIKPEYGPTLGRLLSPRWRAASPLARGVVRVCIAGFIALAIGAFLTLENAHYSQGGAVPLSFAYRGLDRVQPLPGELVRLERHTAAGRLEDSFALERLDLPAYTGELSGVLPVYAAGYIRELRAHYKDFALQAEGKTRVNTVPAYQVVYTAQVDGQTMWGRNVLLLAEKPGIRRGVKIVMLTTPTANKEVKTPQEVAANGVLLRPLKTLMLG
jgi:hypothetical protein